MKITRDKHTKKRLLFYKMSRGLTPPYKVLVDGNFIFVAIEQHIMIREILEGMLDKMVLYTTTCVLHELSVLGGEFIPALNIARTYKVLKCGHGDNHVVASQCLRSLFGTTNPKGFMCATQDKKLRAQLRAIPMAPLFYINYNLISLEEPSQASKDQAARGEVQKLHASKDDRLAALGPKPQFVERPKKKKAKGPNPLSVRKKSKDEAPRPSKNEGGSDHNHSHKGKGSQGDGTRWKGKAEDTSTHEKNSDAGLSSSSTSSGTSKKASSSKANVDQEERVNSSQQESEGERGRGAKRMKLNNGHPLSVRSNNSNNRGVLLEEASLSKTQRQEGEKDASKKEKHKNKNKNKNKRKLSMDGDVSG